MAEQTIEQRIKTIIVDQLNVNEEQVVPTASFIDDLGADSLDTVELIMAFEEEFSDEIDSWIIEELAKAGLDTAKSVLEQDAVDLVKRTDLEEETINDVLKILKEEFED